MIGCSKRTIERRLREFRIYKYLYFWKTISESIVAASGVATPRPRRPEPGYQLSNLKICIILKF